MLPLPEPMSQALARVAAWGGVIAFLLEAALVALLFRGATTFRLEMSNVDRLVAEYVRCRDFLLAGRRGSPETGWRSADGEAFREAWGNFNNRLGVIRERYVKAARGQQNLLYPILALLVLNAANWAAVGGAARLGLEAYLGILGSTLTAFLLWLTTWLLVRRQLTFMTQRTAGDSLIAPWPADGGAPEKQLAAFEKFLPVEGGREGLVSSPEDL